jgi:hypothetical protein
MRFAAVTMAIFTVALFARADILPPNSKWISHVVRFENISDYSEYVFYVYPRDLHRGHPGNSSIRVPENGEVAISGLNPLVTGGGIFLFAVPRSIHGPDATTAKEEWFDGKTPGVLKSNPLAHPVRTVASSDARDRIVTKYRIDMKDGLKLDEIGPEPTTADVSVVSGPTIVSEEAGGFGRWRWIGVCAAAGLAIGFAVWLAVRKKV